MPRPLPLQLVAHHLERGSRLLRLGGRRVRLRAQPLRLAPQRAHLLLPRLRRVAQPLRLRHRRLELRERLLPRRARLLQLRRLLLDARRRLLRRRRRLARRLLLARLGARQLRPQRHHLRVAVGPIAGAAAPLARQRRLGRRGRRRALRHPLLRRRQLLVQRTLPRLGLGRLQLGRRERPGGEALDSRPHLGRGRVDRRRDGRVRGAAQRVKIAPQGEHRLHAERQRLALAPPRRALRLLAPIALQLDRPQQRQPPRRLLLGCLALVRLLRLGGLRRPELALPGERRVVARGTLRLQLLLRVLEHGLQVVHLLLHGGASTLRLLEPALELLHPLELLGARVRHHLQLRVVRGGRLCGDWSGSARPSLLELLFELGDATLLLLHLRVHEVAHPAERAHILVVVGHG